MSSIGSNDVPDRDVGSGIDQHIGQQAVRSGIDHIALLRQGGLLEDDHDDTTLHNEFYTSFLASLSSGTVQTVIFNPWDKANYLAIKNHRSFLDKRNFVQPFQGVTNNLFGRFISCGLYFTFLDEFKQFYSSKTDNPLLSSLGSGITTGAIVATMTNPHAAVKYQMWGKNNVSFFPYMRTMYQNGGIGVFKRGLFFRIGRDVKFSIIFSISHDFFKDKFQDNRIIFVTDMFSTFVANVGAGPYNYIMNHQYARGSDQEMLYGRHIAKELMIEGKMHNHSPLFYLGKLHIGWGTMRVCLAMSLGYQVYDFVKTELS